MENVVKAVISQADLDTLKSTGKLAYNNGFITLNADTKEILYTPNKTFAKKPYTAVQPSLRNSIDTLSLSVEDTEDAIRNCLDNNNKHTIKYTSSGVGGSKLEEQIKNGTARTTEVWCTKKDTPFNDNALDYRNYNWYFKELTSGSISYPIKLAIVQKAIDFVL